MPEKSSRLPPDRKTPFQKVWRVADEQSVPEFSIILFLILSHGKVPDAWEPSWDRRTPVRRVYKLSS
jgi:hypothetical protein